MNNLRGKIKQTCVKLLSVCVIMVTIVAFSSCDKKFKNNAKVEKTLFMYYPWTSNLGSFFENNIADMEKCILNNDMSDYRVVVFFATSQVEATLFELRRTKNAIKRVEYKKYTTFNNYQTGGLTELLNDVKRFSPSNSYSMTISSHGWGWLPKYRSVDENPAPMLRMPSKENDLPMTRFFGGTSTDTQMDIDNFAIAIENANMHMECILFDACYMANVEVAYELRNVCDYFIASPSEILAYGMPYAIMGKALLDGDYKKVCDDFFAFYSAFTIIDKDGNQKAMPYGTIAVVESAKMNDFAAAMKSLNNKHKFDSSDLMELQRLDAYSPTIFFDCGSYLKFVGSGSAENAAVMTALNDAVIFKNNTDKYFTDTYGEFDIQEFSGLTISDPSEHGYTINVKERTQWYKDTH